MELCQRVMCSGETVNFTNPFGKKNIMKIQYLGYLLFVFVAVSIFGDAVNAQNPRYRLHYNGTPSWYNNP